MQRAGTIVTHFTTSNNTCLWIKVLQCSKGPPAKPALVQARLKLGSDHLGDPEEDWENLNCSEN